MKLLFTTLALLLSTSAFADGRPILIGAKFSIDGKPVSSPQIMAMDREEASIRETTEGSPDMMSLQILPKTMNDGKIYLKLAFKSVRGQKTIEAETEVVAKSGEVLEIPLRENAKARLEIKATIQ